MTPRYSAYDNWLSTDKAMEEAQGSMEARDAIEVYKVDPATPICPECGHKYINLVNGVNLQVCHRCEEGTFYED